jgi:hypothetical protein
MILDALIVCAQTISIAIGKLGSLRTKATSEIDVMPILKVLHINMHLDGFSQLHISRRASWTFLLILGLLSSATSQDDTRS